MQNMKHAENKNNSKWKKHYVRRNSFSSFEDIFSPLTFPDLSYMEAPL